MKVDENSSEDVKGNFPMNANSRSLPFIYTPPPESHSTVYRSDILQKYGNEDISTRMFFFNFDKNRFIQLF